MAACLPSKQRLNAEERFPSHGDVSMELIPKATFSSQAQPNCRACKRMQPDPAFSSSSEAGDGKVTLPLPQQSQVLSSSTRGLQEVKTIKIKKAKQGTKSFLLPSRTYIVCRSTFSHLTSYPSAALAAALAKGCFTTAEGLHALSHRGCL